MAYLDHVTGLPNRYAYERALSGILGRAKRTGTRVNVLFLELSNAKWIIDVFGHAASDQYLRYTGQTLDKLTQGELQKEFGIDQTDRGGCTVKWRSVRRGFHQLVRQILDRGRCFLCHGKDSNLSANRSTRNTSRDRRRRCTVSDRR